MVEKTTNNHINTDFLLRYTPQKSGYVGRYVCTTSKK